MISIIAAIGKNRELGAKNKLLWHIPKDLKRFKNLTIGKVVIMGKKTFDSLPKKFKPLPQRINVVLTRDKSFSYPSVLVYSSLEKALTDLKKKYQEIFIIGGASIYQQTINLADKIYLTIVKKDFPQADVFFPQYDHFEVVDKKEDFDKNYRLTFLTLVRKNFKKKKSW